MSGAKVELHFSGFRTDLTPAADELRTKSELYSFTPLPLSDVLGER
jgi:hypothetical protein